MKSLSRALSSLTAVLFLSLTVIACGGGSSSPPPDLTPNSFTFAEVTDVELSTVIESNPVTISGIDDSVSVSITGGEFSINGGAFSSGSATIDNGQSIAVRVTSSDSFSTSVDTTLTVGGVSGAFRVTTLAEDITPDAFSFNAQMDAALNTAIESNEITVSGINTAAAISIVGGEYSIGGAAFVSTEGTVNSGDTVVVRLTSSSEYVTQTEATLTIGTESAAFQVTTAADTTPDAFTFNAQEEVAPNTQVESNSVVISGLGIATAISITDGEYSIDGGVFTNNAGTIDNGQSVVVRQTASAEVETVTSAVLTIGDVDGSFDVTTEGRYNFEGFTGAALNARLQTHIIQINGIGDQTPISIENGEYQLDRGTWTNQAGFMNDGQEVRVRARAGADYNLTTTAKLNVGESWGYFSIATKEHGDFISVWKTDNFGTSNDNQISLPLEADGTYNFNVDWGDGSSDMITQWNQAEVTHTYTEAGSYTVTISGEIAGFRFNNSGDVPKLTEIRHWGELRLGNNGFYFMGASQLAITANDALNLIGTSNMNGTFSSGPLLRRSSIQDGSLNNVARRTFNESLKNWDVSSVTEMDGMFQSAQVPQGNLERWDVSSVTDMDNMFFYASAFSAELSQWDVSSVTHMRNMFFGVSAFNNNVSKWNISSVTDMSNAFDNSGLSVENYSAALTAWNQLNGLQSNVTLGADGISYSASAATARGELINTKGWTITDAGQEPVK